MGIHHTKTEYDATLTLKGEVDSGVIIAATRLFSGIAFQRNYENNGVRVETKGKLTNISFLYTVEDSDEKYFLSEGELAERVVYLQKRLKSSFDGFDDKYENVVVVDLTGKGVRIFEDIPFCHVCQSEANFTAMKNGNRFRRSPEEKKDSNFIKVVPQLPLSPGELAAALTFTAMEEKRRQEESFEKYMAEQQQAAWDARTGY